MIRFTKYAKTEILILSLSLAGDVVVMVILSVIVHPWLGLILAALSLPIYLWFFAFFRDPIRNADRQKLSDRVLYAPADGRVTEISEYDEPRLGGRARKIGIFLSIFDVHINRSPCTCKVLSVDRRQGQFLDARDVRSGEMNSSVDLLLEPDRGMMGRLPSRVLVRQIAGILARRIVCEANVGDILNAGQPFGMIKFGSRTELIVPAEGGTKVLVTLGQKVRAGNDGLIQYA